MAQVLIDRGAKVNKLDNEGKSVLMVTVDYYIVALSRCINTASHFEKQ